MKLIIRKRKKRQRKQRDQKQQSQQQQQKQSQQKIENLQEALAKNANDIISRIQATMGNSSDLITRTFTIGQGTTQTIALLYIDGLADAKFVQNFITETLMIDLQLLGFDKKQHTSDKTKSTNDQQQQQKLGQSTIQSETEKQEHDSKPNRSAEDKQKDNNNSLQASNPYQSKKGKLSNERTNDQKKQQSQQDPNQQPKEQSPKQSNENKQQSQAVKSDPFITFFKNRYLANSEIKEISNYQVLFEHLLAGDSIILLDGYETGFAIGSKGFESRSVEEPTSQVVVRGPKEGFTEKLRTNTSLIRRRIKDPNLWIENKVVGKKTKTDVTICYIKGVAKDDIVKEVHKRIDRINIDGILESGYIEELIQDETYSPFPTVYNTERPDVICAGLLEGRIAILVDGTPFALLVPALFVHFFQASEDFYQRADIATMMRMLRYLCFFLALLTPSAYIALTTFHQEMIPTQLLISLAAQREGVPFPAYVEALMMEITFEILREAGTRMPRAVGSAISIVGALVLGQAAVEAGIVSSAMVIVVSLTAISSFVSPTFNMSISIRMLRFIFMTLAAVFGLVGIILGLIIMVMHLTSLRSFGIPYLSPMGPFIPSDQKDTMVRLPLWKMKNRPRLINQTDIEREETDSPKPPEKS